MLPDMVVGRSEAARLLPVKLAAKGWNQAALTREMTARLGHVAAGLVSRWVSGKRIPTATQAGWLELELGLPARLWASRAKEKAA
jgi:hypothetical protein